MNLQQVPGVCMDPHIHLASTWRTGVGKLLTNRRIRELELEGYYGKERQLRAHKKVLLTRRGDPIACACGEAIGVKFLRWSYLPKAGHYCPKCVKRFQAERDREAEERRSWQVRMEEKYV